MSPEVRFTRTPERVLKERRMQTPAQATPDALGRQSKEIASARAADPAPAVQERLLALQNKAASQEVGNGAPRAFTRAPSHVPDPAKRVPPVRPRADVSQRAQVAPAPATAEPAPTPKVVTPAETPAKSSPAPFELSTVQQTYSFMWQPGTYLLDPTLPAPVEPVPAAAPAPMRSASVAPVRAEQEKNVPVVKKAAPPAAARPRVPPAPPAPPVEPEILPWEEDEDDVEAEVDMHMEHVDDLAGDDDVIEGPTRRAAVVAPKPRLTANPPVPAAANDSFRREGRDNYASVSIGVSAPVRASFEFELPALELLAEPKIWDSAEVPVEVLQENAATLENVLWDFNVKGEIINVRPGPVVTLYELEPAPGTKSSRVISLADDIARSMSAVSARVAVVQGRNAIGIELPNHKRETVYLRELLASQDFETSKQKLALCLGKTIGGEPVIADLARMPHLLVAGTTGSGKSVAINTMILSLVYRLSPAECRLIMVDPKMLELSVYDGIPHLLTPVVTDPKKAVVALKWAVREMEDRYRKMSKLGVRNIDGFNARVVEAKARGETITRTVQTGFDRETGEAVYEDEVMDLDALPYIVVIVDEMADLMMVAGKEIEGAIQRLAQMARAAGIHVILATQRPSVDVITGTIKANFPTRISFQVTSKIDSRTILGEMGAEQLLGQGDMLYMAGGGRITRVHGPFCSDEEVEKVVAHLKRQGRPQYLEAVTAEEDEGGGAGADAPVFDQGEFGAPGGDLYDQAVAVVLRDKKASTSYIQRRLQIGYNRAASLMERMENEGIVGPANHAGKREILINHLDMDD
ncbi:DNA translocase FtsK [Microvirga lotononidis]|uniref:DNA translocase FtsK n=2 Tax=Microvirga lotononidis TaxID=864069 RepID=UPI002AF6C456|nr:DNA translocase FtsK [Microvirga lotononidis]WQO26574.1 DNA translocase FtsK [Microvirga lotononidis]